MANVISFQREPEFYYNLALKAIKCSDYATAIRELLTAIKLDEKPDYLRELAECYYAIGAYKESIDIFYKLYEFSYSKECFNKIMRSYYRIENVLFDDLDIENMELEDLAEILDVPVKSNGNSTNFWAKTNSIDETIQKLGDYFHNEKTWLLKINTKEIRDREKLASAVMALNSGDYDKAISVALEIINDEDLRTKALKVLATAGAKVEDYEMSLKAASELLEVDGEEVVAFNILLYLAKYADIENAPNAKELCERVFKKVAVKNSVEELTLYGIFAFNMEEFEYAIKALEMVYKNCPLNVDVIHNYAIALMKVKRIGDARRVVKQARLLFPTTARLILDEWLVENLDKGVILDENNFILDKFTNEEPTVIASQILKRFESELERVIIEEGTLNRLTNNMLDLMNALVATNDFDAIQSMLFKLDELDDIVYQNFLFECLKSVYLDDEIRELMLVALIAMPRKINGRTALLVLPYTYTYSITSVEYFGDMREKEIDVYMDFITTLFRNKVGFVNSITLHNLIKKISKTEAFKAYTKNVISATLYYELEACEEDRDSELVNISKWFEVSEDMILKAHNELFDK